MKKVLIISYYWPPASGPGVQRWLKFAKYLPEYGYQPFVITPRNGSYPNRDESLVAEIPAAARVIKTRTAEPFAWFNILSGQAGRGKTSAVGMADIRGSKSLFKKTAAYIRANFFIPDARVGWVPYALMAAEKLLKSEEIDTVISTGPPHSSHLAGLRLKKKYNVKWIADMRDPWTNIYYNAYLPRTEKSKARDRKMEDDVLQSADAVMTVSPGLAEEFSDRAARIELIYNGFDTEDFADTSGSDRPDDFFRISYVGNFKANQNVHALWRALAALRAENPLFAEHFRLELTGNISDSVLQDIRNAGLSEHLLLNEFVDHARAIDLMRSAGLLLLPIPVAENNRQILTGKLFEYLASGSELLAIGPPDGNAAEILNETGRPAMIDYGDEAEMRQRIELLFEKWLPRKSLEKHPIESVMKYSRKEQTALLAELIDRLNRIQ